MTQETFDAKMDTTIEVMLEAMNRLDGFNDDDFSVALAAFRFVASLAMAEGWTQEDLAEHLEAEWQLAKELEEDYRKTLN